MRVAWPTTKEVGPMLWLQDPAGGQRGREPPLEPWAVCERAGGALWFLENG